MKRSRFIVGLVLCGASALMLLLNTGPEIPPAAIPLGILGIISIAISRK